MILLKIAIDVHAFSDTFYKDEQYVGCFREKVSVRTHLLKKYNHHSFTFTRFKSHHERISVLTPHICMHNCRLLHYTYASIQVSTFNTVNIW